MRDFAMIIRIVILAANDGAPLTRQASDSACLVLQIVTVERHHHHGEVVTEHAFCVALGRATSHLTCQSELHLAPASVA